MFSSKDTIAGFDPELWEAIQNEGQRQEEHIELIASENYASPPPILTSLLNELDFSLLPKATQFFSVVLCREN